MRDFDELYNNLTKIIRGKTPHDAVEENIRQILEAYPNKKAQLFDRLDAAFGQHGNYTTARAAINQGETFEVKSIYRNQEL